MALKTIKFGSHYLPTYVPELDGSVSEFYEKMFKQMEEMDRLNYDHIWVTEHHFAHYGGDLPHPRHRAATAGPPALVVDALDVRADDPFATTLRGISFSVRAGEIVGVAGVSGNGQKELLAALSGERTLGRASAVLLCATPVGKLGAAARRALGLAFVPEERLGRGAVPEMSLADNALLTTRGHELVAHGFVRSEGVRAYASKTNT
jgi:simple sugar transport system ATP-binding protein